MKRFTFVLFGEIQMRMKYFSKFLIMGAVLLSGCGDSQKGRQAEVIVFHAGSLAVPFSQLKAEFEKKNQGIKIFLEPAGSLVCARKITELKKPCDIIASADYFVINELLIPGYTKWGIRFASNEIVIAFGPKARYASEINAQNWMDILMRKDVIFSRSDPDADPCGYRTVFTIMLTEKLYGKKGLTARLLAKDTNFMRPKEVDLIALIESNAVDYMFQYKSVAIQHGLKYIELPADVNLSDPSKAGIYRTVSLDVRGKEPGTTVKVTGDYINYSISVLDDAPHRDAALAFLGYLLSPDGMQILEHNGQRPIIPALSDQKDQIPAILQKFLTVDK